MSDQRLQNNLVRLLTELKQYLQTNSIEPTEKQSKRAAFLAPRLFLAHSTTSSGFEKICQTNFLYSPRQLDEKNLKELKTKAVERVLGTEDSVFLYANRFFLPTSGCGFLYKPSVENSQPVGSATPFDTGGLVDHYPPPEAENAHEYFERHELPLPRYREYLESSLSGLWETPDHYLDGKDPMHHGPLPHSGGDFRSRTYEVRLRDQLAIRHGHLQAVFIASRMASLPEVEEYSNWCLSEGFDVQLVASNGQNEHSQLKKACVKYLQTKLKQLN